MAPKVNQDLIYLYKSALESISGQNVIQKVVKLSNDGILSVNPSVLFCPNPISQDFDLNSHRLYLIGAGKCVLGLAQAFLQLVDGHKSLKFGRGVLSLPTALKQPIESSTLDKYNVQMFFGAKNNIPDEDSVAASQKILNLIDELNDKDEKSLLVTLISGGGSALLACPKSGLSLERKRGIIDQLVKSGSTIEELNQVRRVLSQVKGGKLAARIRDPSKVKMVTLIASDIIGDPIDLIASGPTVPVIGDAAQQAKDVLNKHDINLSSQELDMLSSGETRKSDKSKSFNVIVVNNSVALSAMTSLAIEIGYEVIFLGNEIQGEAKDVAVKLANVVRGHVSKNSDKPLLFIGGGETTVTFDPKMKPGLGGRCQEMALSFFTETFCWNEHIVFMAVGSDGQDGPTPVAGVMTTCGGLNIMTGDEEVAKILAHSSEGLKYHDSFNFWTKHFPECLIDTNGSTGVNVMDFYLFVKK